MKQAPLIASLLEAQEEYLSGEALAKRLNCSRAAVWKWVKQLKHEGFEIHSHPKMGYRLLSLPDIPFPAVVRSGLKTSHFGRTVHYYSTIGSTNDVARRLAENGATEGTLVIADEQSTGRGRLNRTWVSPPKKNLLFTLIFRPAMKPLQVFRLTLISSLSIVRAIEEETGLQALIKWPNDLYLKNKKLCGILTEFACDPDRVAYCLVGIGINVNLDPSRYPEINGLATSIAHCLGREVPRVPILKRILERIEEYYGRLQQEGVAALRSEWNNLSFIVGKRVMVTSGESEEEGVAESIDEDGFLILRDVNGGQKRILSGDVSLRLT